MNLQWSRPVWTQFKTFLHHHPLLVLEQQSYSHELGLLPSDVRVYGQNLEQHSSQPIILRFETNIVFYDNFGYYILIFRTRQNPFLIIVRRLTIGFSWQAVLDY